MVQSATLRDTLQGGELLGTEEFRTYPLYHEANAHHKFYVLHTQHPG